MRKRISGWKALAKVPFRNGGDDGGNGVLTELPGVAKEENDDGSSLFRKISPSSIMYPSRNIDWESEVAMEADGADEDDVDDPFEFPLNP